MRCNLRKILSTLALFSYDRIPKGLPEKGWNLPITSSPSKLVTSFLDLSTVYRPVRARASSVQTRRHGASWIRAHAMCSHTLLVIAYLPSLEGILEDSI